MINIIRNDKVIYTVMSFCFFQVFMIDTITKQASWLGVCVLPVFVKSGTFDRADDTDSKVHI